MSDEKICFPADTFAAFAAIMAPLIDVEQAAVKAVESFNDIEVDLPRSVWTAHVDLALSVTKARGAVQAVPRELLDQILDIVKDFEMQFVANKKGEADAS